MPSAQTLVRTIQLNVATLEKVSQSALSQQPMLRARDGDLIERIENAVDLAAVLDLAPITRGFGEPVWFKRVRGFGPGAATVIGEWFQSRPPQQRSHGSAGLQEKCITALRWCGEEGIDPLLRCWDDFDDYGRSLACVMLGLLGAQRGADKIWDFYLQVKTKSDENLRVGALWGLIDLKDARVADALVELLQEGRNCYELFGFLSRAGGQGAVLPLLYAIMKGTPDIRAEAMWALTGIGHRIGRTALRECLTGGVEPDDAGCARVDANIDHILSYSESEVEEYFSVFYQSEMNDLNCIADDGLHATALA